MPHLQSQRDEEDDLLAQALCQSPSVSLRRLVTGCSDRVAPWQRSPGNTYETHALSWLRNDESTPGRWHRGLVKFHVFANVGQLFRSAPAQAHSLAGHGYALASHTHALAAGGAAGLGRLGGGGFGRVIVHLFIWRLIWRVGLGLWHIPTVGPFVVVLLIAAIVALGIVRKQRGPRWWNNRGGSTGAGTGRGPRDW